MPLLVMKFGGTSVADLDRIANAARKVQREVERGYDVIVIVSAMSGKTNELVGWCREAGLTVRVDGIGNIFARREGRDPSRPPHVRVSGRTEGETAVFEVADNGRGIAERDRERVFEPFRRAGTPDVPGEGIGLAHVRALVRRMGGTITFTSALREGTTFRVRLPRRMQHAMDAA